MTEKRGEGRHGGRGKGGRLTRRGAGAAPRASDESSLPVPHVLKAKRVPETGAEVSRGPLEVSLSILGDRVAKEPIFLTLTGAAAAVSAVPAGIDGPPMILEATAVGYILSRMVRRPLWKFSFLSITLGSVLHPSHPSIGQPLVLAGTLCLAADTVVVWPVEYLLRHHQDPPDAKL